MKYRFHVAVTTTRVSCQKYVNVYRRCPNNSFISVPRYSILSILIVTGVYFSSAREIILYIGNLRCVRSIIQYIGNSAVLIACTNVSPPCFH